MSEQNQQRADVLIVGGGIIGLTLALRLDAHGISSIVLEGEEPGHGATWASAGMLAPQGEATAPGPGFDLARRGLGAYPPLGRELLETTGIDIELRDEGSLHLAFDEEEERRLRDTYAWQIEAGFEVLELSAGEVLEREAEISPEVRRGFLVSDDIQVNPRLLVSALARAVRVAGATLLSGEPVLRLRLTGGRLDGLETDKGVYEAPRVVLCTGAWAGRRLEGIPPTSVHPIRGQIVTVSDGSQPPIRHCLHGHGVYIVPRLDGRTLIGATMEDAGFDCRVTEEAIAGLHARGGRVVPRLAGHPRIEAVAGLRPDTPDHQPLIGPWGPEGLFLAAGHFRQGIVTAPATADLLARWLATGTRPDELEPFDPARFARGAHGST